jgi:hypothetical protein
MFEDSILYSEVIIIETYFFQFFQLNLVKDYFIIISFKEFDLQNLRVHVLIIHLIHLFNNSDLY